MIPAPIGGSIGAVEFVGGFEVDTCVKEPGSLVWVVAICEVAVEEREVALFIWRSILVVPVVREAIKNVDQLRDSPLRPRQDKGVVPSRLNL